MRFRPLRFSSLMATVPLALAALSSLALSTVARADDAPLGADFAIKSGDRVVFYGDSITEQRQYTLQAEEYIVTRFPQRHITFTHSGWGGDTVGGGGGGPIDVRLDRDVTPYHPTVVTIMLAMNDAGYRAFDQPLFQKYATGYKHIADKIKADNPGVRLTFIQPSPYDDVTQPPKFDGGYNAVLVRYGDYLKTLATDEGGSVADFNTPVVAMLGRANTTDPKTAQKIIPDRVHPSWGGHLVMAEALLRSWNAPSLVSSVTVHAASGKSETVNARVDGFSPASSTGTIAWRETEGSLPFPIEPPEFWTADSYKLALQSSDFIDALDREMLTVTDLPGANYTLKIDNQDVAVFTREQLAAGVNLAPLSTPMLSQAELVANLTRRHVDTHNARWREMQVPMAGNTATQRMLPTVLSEMDAAEAVVETRVPLNDTRAFVAKELSSATKARFPVDLLHQRLCVTTAPPCTKTGSA